MGRAGEKHIRVLRAADERGGALANFVAEASWRAGATMLKEDRDSTVYRGVDDAGAPIVVKCMVMRGVRRRLASRLGRSRLARQWRGSALLRVAGISTATCRVLFRAGHTETLVLDWVEGPTVAERAVQGGMPVREEHALAEAIGVQVLAMAQAGLFNRDHKASNLVIRKCDDGEPEIVLIDTVGIRKGLTATNIMLAKVMIELIGIGAMPRRALRMRALQAAGSSKKDWPTVAKIIHEHGDPVPKINPVGDCQKV